MRARQYVSRLGEQGVVWMEVIPGGRTETSKEVGDPSGMPAALTTGADVSRESNRSERLTTPTSKAGGLEDPHS